MGGYDLISSLTDFSAPPGGLYSYVAKMFIMPVEGTSPFT